MRRNWQASLFGDNPSAEVVIAEYQNSQLALLCSFTNYSTFLAQPGIYLEDLFVQ